LAAEIDPKMMRQYDLVDRVRRYNPNADEDLLNRAYVYAMKAHGQQKRASGDPYFSHPLEVAAILTDLKLDDATIAKFQRELGAMGYKFQFVTLAGFHALNNSMFELADGYRDRGMAAYSELQQREFANEAIGYTATRHQREVGTGYFDQVATVISNGQSSTTAMKESTETAQFVAAE
jgi:isocitrate lyase